jgi:hypothetical protein
MLIVSRGSNKPTANHPRRICAGDWVRFVGPRASVRGLGKVVEGDYDPVDSTLRSARVEFARLTLWVLPGDLRRIEPEEEMRLVEDAIENVLMPEPAANRIRMALRDPDRLQFVRSPGFLDLLWGLVGSLPDERAVQGLARFFDEGEIAWKRDPKPEPTPRPPLAARIIIEPPEPPDEAVPDLAAERPIRSGTVLERVLATLNHNVLRDLAVLKAVPFRKSMPIASLRDRIAASGIELTRVLATLTENQLAQAADALCVAPSDNASILRARILLLARPEAPETRPALDPRVILESLDIDAIFALALANPVPAGAAATPSDLRSYLAASGLDVWRLVRSLSLEQLRRAARNAGLATEGTADELATRILGGGHPPSSADASSPPAAL